MKISVRSISRTLFPVLPLMALLLSTTYSPSEPQTNGTGTAGTVSSSASGLGQVTVKGTRVAEIDSSHVRIAVDLAVTPSRSVTLEDMRLTGLRLNGLPVYAEPLTQPIDLGQGKENALPPMYVIAQVRDLTTAAPLREMIEKQSVHVQGQIVADVKMSFLDKLALHTEHPRISLPITQDVPVAFGSTPFARQAALGMLTIIEFGIQGSSVARKNFPGLESPWVHELEAQANANLLQVETSYVLKEHDTSYPVVLDQLGFRLSSGQIITTAEAKSPWEYDTEFLGKIKSGEAKMVKNSVEVQLRSTAKQSSGETQLMLTHKDFTLEERGTVDKDALIIQKGQKEDKDQPEQKDQFAKVNVQRRASPNALAVIVLREPPPAGGFHSAPTTIAQQDSWEKVAVYRLIVDSTSVKPSIEVVQFSARRDGQGIHFDQPVDPSFYGSPIMVPEGVLGIVQDEQSGAFLPTDLATAAASGVAAQQAENDPVSQ